MKRTAVAWFSLLVALLSLAAPVAAQNARDLILPYLERAERIESSEVLQQGEVLDNVIPLGFVAWWQEAVVSPLGTAPRHFAIDGQDLVLRALEHSAQVQVFRDTALIRQVAVSEAAADFDLRAFMESRFTDTSEPIGNLLTTGRPGRFREEDFGYTAGLRKRTPFGGQLEVSQKVGLQDNNSQFFIPPQQGTARLSLSFTQPLLNGAGRLYNNAALLVAEIDARAATDQLAEQLQDYLLAVHRAYWDLYVARTALLQQRRLYEAGRTILAELEQRQHVDALQSQVLQARARVARRNDAIVHGQRRVRNAEARIRALVNDPQFSSAYPLELVPREVPGTTPIRIQLSDALVTALQNRPESKRALKSIEVAAVRADVARNELLPKLDLILESYVSGLQGDYQLGEALGDQFRLGEPSYSAGLLFEIPLGNRAARARYERTRLIVRQLTNQFRALLEQLLAEVEVATRDVHTSFVRLQTTYHSMLAGASELRYLHERWRLLPGDDEVTSILLENLLQSQERLADAELDFAQAQVAYSVSLVELKRAQGTLLQIDALPPAPAVDVPERPGELPPQAGAARQMSPLTPLPPPLPEVREALGK